MSKHWSRNLAGGLGREIEHLATNIESLEAQRRALQRKLLLINNDLDICEHDILSKIRQEWTNKEIIKAREPNDDNNK